MNKLLTSIFVLLSIMSGVQSVSTSTGVDVANNCISFTIGQGTGCEWMCNYCANQLGTNNYYFTDGVCTYQSGGCVGNPIADKQYTCCAVSQHEEL